MREFAFTGDDLLVEYYEVFREFGLPYPRGSGGGRQKLRFCPWCGRVLPAGLRETWFELVREGSGLLDAWPRDRRVPKEFKSDEWWRKRGL